MTVPERRLSDTQIEAAILRRIGGHADASLARSIAATAAATPQTHGLRAIGGGRLRAVAVLAAAAIAIMGLAVAAAGSRLALPSPIPSQPALVMQPTSSPAPVGSPAATAQGVCATDTVSVSTGGSMPPATAMPATDPAGMIEHAVYLTRRGGATQTDVWSVASGGATRIASLVAPVGDSIVTLDDVSADGRQALIGVGVSRAPWPGTDCSDLYLVRTDGTSATRLTHDGPNEYAFEGRFSPDGRYVAFGASGGSRAPRLGVVDLVGDRTPRMMGWCSGVTNLRWAPTGEWLAVACDTDVTVIKIDLSLVTAIGIPTHAPPLVDAGPALPVVDARVIDDAWLDPTHVLTVFALPGESRNGPFQVRTLAIDEGHGPATASWSDPVPVSPWLADPGLTPASAPIAPDGHALALLADPVAVDPTREQLALYVVDLANGHAAPAVPWPLADAGWTTDSSALVYVDLSAALHPVLTVRDPSRTDPLATVSLPAEYVTGVWRAASIPSR